ncbi:MAG: hypothetical protein VYC39_19860 [Myxococcota bacterium]|nr:hypothetical protein [Myxococcota bacterium]
MIIRIIFILLLASAFVGTTTSLPSVSIAKKRAKKKKKTSRKSLVKKRERKAKTKKFKAISQPSTATKDSELKTKALSRWSNLGAMTPIKTEVPVQAELPKRNQPRLTPVITPGQSLTGRQGQFSSRISAAYYHVTTLGQDIGYDYSPDNPRIVLLENANRDISLYRLRLDANYTRIKGSWFSAHTDGEYRGSRTTSRPTEYRLNSLHLSYGMTAHRKKREPVWGLQMGRVPIREAGFLSVDGLVLRAKPMEKLVIGAFGGLTNNPFRFNYRLYRPEEFSSDWSRFGAMASWSMDNFFIEMSGAATYYQKEDFQLDRVAVYLNSGLSLSKDLDLFIHAWIDGLDTGQRIQNLQAIAAYRPSRQMYFRFVLERFSTIMYRFSTPESFERDPLGALVVPLDQQGNEGAQTSTIVDENGNPVDSFNSELQVATYSAARLRAGYKFAPKIEGFLQLDTLMRTPDQYVDPTSIANFRFLPGIGLIYKNRRLFDAEVRSLAIVDDSATNRALLRLRAFRTWKGLTGTLDGQWFLGEENAADGGISLAYQFPLSWFPGRLQIRSMFRYFYENVSLEQPTNGAISLQRGVDELRVIPVQESYMGYLGVDWKM